MLSKNFKTIPSDSRIVPVEVEIEAGEEISLPYEAVSKIIDTSSPIGVAVCYCRHRKDLLENSCEKTDMRVNCLMFGKPAQFCIEQDFAKEITAEEAKKILIESAEAGLIHKTFHSKLDLNREVTAICNCCGCCCGGIESLHKGSSPLITVASYLAQVDLEDCTGCGTCVEKCQVSAIELIDEKSVINQDHCIGCGQCAQNCPSDAINMERTGLRKVFVPPAKVEIN
jgi:ferredoxin